MRFTIYQESRQGGRANNEDRTSYCYSREALLMVIADGMGGHAGGEVASSLTLQVFRKHFIEAARSSRPLDRLQESLLVANEAVRSAIQPIWPCRPMSTKAASRAAVSGVASAKRSVAATRSNPAT